MFRINFEKKIGVKLLDDKTSIIVYTKIQRNGDGGIMVLIVSFLIIHSGNILLPYCPRLFFLSL